MMNSLLLENLASDEPILRYSTLLQLLSGKEFISLNEEQVLSIISLLEDSQKKIRFAALNVLSKYSSRLGLLEKSVIFTIVNNTLKAFHGIRNKEDFEKFTANIILETRIQALYALKGFIKLVDDNAQICNYLNFLLTTILASKSSELLKVAAVKVINEFPKTSRNIKRVFTLFKTPIQSLEGSEMLTKERERFSCTWEYLGFVKPQKAPESRDIQRSRSISRKWIKVEHFSKRKEKEISFFGSLLSINSQNLLSLDNTKVVDPMIQSELNKGDEKGGFIKFGTEKAMVFSQFPFQDTVYIRNVSDKDVIFSLQIYPSEFFTLSPATGTLKGAESLGVTVVFSPNPFNQHILQMIHGFIRIRSMGLALDRLELIGYNLPHVRITPEIIDFDIVQTFESKTAYISLENFLPVDIKAVTIIRKLEKDSPFTVDNAQVSLKGSSRTNISVNLYPRKGKGPLQEEVIICVLGNIYKVKLVGIVGEPLKVLNHKLNFGFTAISSERPFQNLYLKNASKKSLPVTYLCTSNEIIINDNLPIILNPEEERAISVEFIPNCTGDRKESIQIFAPYSSISAVDIFAFVGQSLLVPIHEDIFFPVVMVDGMSSIHFPMTNVYHSSMQFFVLLPIFSPFKIESIEWERFNRKPTSGGVLADIKTIEAGGKTGFIVTLGTNVTAVVELSFSPTSSRLVRTQLEITSVKPTKSYLKTLYLNAVALDLSFFRQEGISLSQIRKFSRNPFREPITASFSTVILPETKRLRNSSKVFQLDPPSQVVFGSYLERKLRTDIHEYVTLTNTTNRTQKFQLIVSQHFVIDIPLEGELPSLSSLQIPVRLNRYFFTIGVGITEETQSFTGAGSITVLDSNSSHPGAVTVNLYGFLNDLVAVEVRQDMEIMRFPNSAPSQSSIRSIHLRNCIPMDVVWEAGIGSTEDKSLQRRSDGSPFRLSSNRVNLKPYEYFTIDISFMSTIPGFYNGRLFMEYRDFVEHGGIFDKSIIEPSRSLMNLKLECLVGNYLMDVESTCIDFGNVSYDSFNQKNIEVNNMSHESQSIQCNQSKSFSYSMDNQLIKPNSKSLIGITYQAGEKGFRYDYLLTVYPFSFSSIFCMAWSGNISLSSNLGDFSKISGSDEYILDVKQINVGLMQKEVKSLRLENTGSFDVLISEINLEGEPLVFEYQVKDNLLSRFYKPQSDEKDENSPRFDWDEYQYNSNQARSFNSISLHKLTKKVGSVDLLKKEKSSNHLHEKPIKKLTKSTYDAYIFPILLCSGKFIDIDIIVNSEMKGLFVNSIQFIVEPFGQKKQSFRMKIPFLIQPFLVAEPNILDFGICSHHKNHVSSVKFTNNAAVTLNWSAEYVDTIISSLTEPEKLEVLQFSAPLEIFPLSGTLAPDHSQTIYVSFFPMFKNFEVLSQLNLKTNLFGSSKIFVKGIGACSSIKIDCETLNFGALRIGTKKVMKFSVKNTGILPTRFLLESPDISFITDPEAFVVEGMCDISISVIFCPKITGKINSNLLLVPLNPKESQIIKINLQGIGSYPDICVLTRHIDFGIALFMTQNIKPIEIENRGTAEAEIAFSCSHPGIQLGIEGGDTLIRPMSSQIFNLVYTPQTIETLNSKILIRSSDSRAFEYVVSLKGSVGVPKLVLEPPEIVNGIDFDTVFLFNTVRKEFIIKNDGNIILKYNISTEKIKETTIMNKVLTTSSDSDAAEREIFCIEASSGMLQVGQSKVIVVKFTPQSVKEYQYDIILSYDYQCRKFPMVGRGGQFILQMDNHLRSLDFGVCRISRTFKKVLKLKNLGNLGFRYLVKPEPQSKIWGEYREEVSKFMKANISWENSQESRLESEKEIVAHGFSLNNHQGVCSPFGYADVTVSFSPTSETAHGICLRIFYEDNFIDIDVQGQGASPKLSLFDPLTKQYITKDGKSVIDIGVHPVDLSYGHIVQLINEGAFGLDFYVQPMAVTEFDVAPVRGFIEAQDSVPLTIKFKASSESNFHSPLKIFWEKESIKSTVVGKGGLGKMQLIFNGQDSIEKGFNFGNLPLSSSNRKKFAVNNTGMVAMNVLIDLSHDEFSIAKGCDALSMTQVSNALYSGILPKEDYMKWSSAIRILLEPNSGILVVVKFSAKSVALSSATLVVRTEFDKISMPVLGHGGTITLSHKGDLNFGEIACNYTYSRSIVLVNTGSISANISARFSIAGHSCSDENPAFVKFSEVYTGLDPRAGWARQQYCREKNLDTLKAKLGPREYWKLVAYMILKHLVKEEIVETSRSKLVQARRSSIVGMMTSSHARVSASGLKKVSNVNASTHFKRKQMFYHLITSTQLTSQSTCRVKPFMKAEPGIILLPSYGDVSYNVEVNVSTEAQIIGTLMLTSDIPNTLPYEIPISLLPKSVNIVCDDTRIINFYRQPLGSAESIVRAFSNVGKKDISFKFINANTSLTVSPQKGVLKVGANISVTFTFKPIDESIQNSDIIFEPDCSQPIKLKVYGGGGQAVASLSRYKRFDFGHCMIGKDTVSYLPIYNEGNAVLHLSRFELVETATFFKGPDWPTSRISLFPGKSFNLPIVFNPSEESVSPGRLVVGTNSETFEIELTGSGREAVLIVSKVALEFSECLIGNSYEQKLGLKNIGDVNYPVTFKLEKEFPDVEFVPSSMLITPFTENFVIVSYTPSRETKTTVVLTIHSPYSTHKVPLLLHAGTAILEFDSNTLDFGLFEKSTKPSLNLLFKNTGTVRTSYLVKDPNKPSMFYISQPRGILQPGKSVEVPIVHYRHEIEEFEHKLIVKTDLINKIYTVKTRGQCEQTIVHHDEFSVLNLGTCPVLESSSKPLSFKNYGRFPLSYNIKANYPLKVVPPIGTVDGDETGTVLITWSPSGAYELRGQIVMETNIGNFSINIRGKAIFPDLAVDNMYIDFGICAVNQVYKRKFVVENHGKVCSKFVIPESKDPSFWVSQKAGVLQPKESAEIDIYFKPNAIQRFMSSILVECRGIHYKEIATIGVGGIHKLEIIPSSIDLGRFPYNLQTYVTLALKNSGDVLIEAEFFSKDNSSDSQSKFSLPEPISVAAGRTAKCMFGIKSQAVGQFSSEIEIKTIEGSYFVPVSGIVVQIHLTERNRHILNSEKIAAMQVLETGRFQCKIDESDFILKKYSKSFQKDMGLASKFCDLYSKLGKSGTARTSPDENLDVDSDKLLEFIESIENPSLDVVDSLFDKFIRTKQASYQGYSVVEDVHIKEILEYGYLEIQPVSHNLIINQIEPNVDIDLAVVVSRPPPFFATEKKPQREKKLDNFSVPRSLERRSRNAKTVDFFKT